MCSGSANETNTNNSMKWVPGMQFTRENLVQMRVGSLRRSGLCWCLACRSAAARVAATRAHASQAQYPPAVTAIKISVLLPGAILTSKSGERLDRPQPGLTQIVCWFVQVTTFKFVIYRLCSGIMLIQHTSAKQSHRFINWKDRILHKWRVN